MFVMRLQNKQRFWDDIDSLLDWAHRPHSSPGYWALLTNVNTAISYRTVLTIFDADNELVYSINLDYNYRHIEYEQERYHDATRALYLLGNGEPVALTSVR
jgi:hypothetical protein